MIKKVLQHKMWMYIGFFLLAYFPIFHHLDANPIQNWDEALFGMRAAFMAEEWKYLENFNEVYWRNHPNLKPPFMTLVQALLIKVLPGLKAELILRLPIALSVLALLILFLTIPKQIKAKQWIAFFAGAVLFCSEGFVHSHVSRGADHDVPLALFTFLALFSFYKYTEAETRKNKQKQLLLLFFFLAISFLTKSFVGLLFMPAFVFYLIINGHFKWLLKKELWFLLLALIGLILGYYAIMDYYFPSFIGGIKGHALGRYQRVVDGHSGPWYFYLKRIFGLEFFPFYFLLPVGMLAYFDKKIALKARKFTLLCLLALVSHVFILSFSESKAHWYIAVCYPLMAWLVAMGLLSIQNRVFAFLNLTYKPLVKIGLTILLIGLFYSPYKLIVDRVNFPINENGSEQYAYLMEELYAQGIKEYFLIRHDMPHPAFYAYFYNKNRGTEITVLNRSKEGIKEGDYFMTAHNSDVARVEEDFEVEKIAQKYHCQFYQVKAKK